MAIPIVIHETNQEYGLVVIKFIRQYLSQADKHNGIPVEQTQSQTLKPGQNPYK